MSEEESTLVLVIVKSMYHRQLATSTYWLERISSTVEKVAVEEAAHC